MSNLKYLFITNEVGISENANSNIVWTVCDELRKENEIHIFSVSSIVKQKDSIYKNYPVLSFGPSHRIFDYLAKGKREKKRILSQIIRIVLTPSLWAVAARLVLRKYCGEKSAYIESFFAAKIIRKLNDVNRYDRIVAVSEPYMSVHILSRLKKPRIYLYQLDEYHTNKNKNANEIQWRRKIELQAYRNAHSIYMLEFIKKVYLQTVLAEFKSKWITVEFPLIRQHEKGLEENFVTFMSNKVNCLYCGTLDVAYRNPAFALELAKQLGDDFRFYFIGRNCVELIEHTMKFRDQTVVTYGAVSSEKIYSLMVSADFLVNIGNTMTNQMPSKIIDYISTGKPIINIVKSRECPTLVYTNRYPLCLDVLERDTINADLVSKVDSFCRRHKGCSLPFSKVESLFYDCTPAYVASIIEQS